MTKTISFPSGELHNYRRRLDQGLPIVTTRISAQAGRFHEGEVYQSRLGQLRVVKCQHFADLSDHPYRSEMNRWQYQQLEKYLDERGYDVVELVPV